MRESVDEGDGAGCVWEDGGPVAEGEVGGQDDGAFLVPSGHDLEEQVGGVCIEGQVSDLVDHQQVWADVVADAAFQAPCGFLAIEVEDQIRGGGEEGGAADEDGLVCDVLGEGGFAEALSADEDDVFGAVEEVEAVSCPRFVKTRAGVENPLG